MTENRPYKRIARPSLSLILRTSLWTGGDHLLQVTSNGFSETYQRFNYNDVRGFMIVESSRRAIFNAVWLGICGVFLLFMLSLGMADPSSVFLLIPAIFFGILAAWNTALGPGCRVYIVTRVQTERLRALIRRPKAERVIESLKRTLLEAQKSEAETPNPESPPSLPV